MLIAIIFSEDMDGNRRMETIDKIKKLKKSLETVNADANTNERGKSINPVLEIINSINVNNIND